MYSFNAIGSPIAEEQQSTSNLIQESHELAMKKRILEKAKKIEADNVLLEQGYDPKHRMTSYKIGGPICTRSSLQDGSCEAGDILYIGTPLEALKFCKEDTIKTWVNGVNTLYSCKFSGKELLTRKK